MLLQPGEQVFPLTERGLGGEPAPLQYCGQGAVPARRGEAQPLRHGQGTPRHHRPEKHRQPPQALQQVIQDRIQAGAGGGVLGQLPGGCGHDVAVEVPHELPHLGQGLGELQLREEPQEFRGRLPGQGRHFNIFGPGVAWGRDHPLAVLEGHAQAAGKEVPQVVGQVGVDAGVEGLLAEGGVKPEDHLPEEKVAHLVDAVKFRQGQGLHHVPQALGHLAGGDLPVAMDVELPERVQPCGLEDSGPVDGVGLQDVLGDEVMHGRPVPGVIRAVREAQAGQVIEQGIEPDVGDVTLVEGQGDAPGEALLGPGNTQVLQGLPQKPQDLVLEPFGPDPVRVVLDVAQEPVLVAAHAEEIIFFLDEGGRGLVVGALAVIQLPLQVKALAAVAIEAAVLPEVDVALVVELGQEALHHRGVGRQGGAHKVVVADIEAVPGVAEGVADAVHKSLDRQVQLLGGLDDLVAVLVGAGLEAGVIPLEAVKASQGVRHHGGVGVSQVRLGVDVINGRGDIKSHGRGSSQDGQGKPVQHIVPGVMISLLALSPA